jgi:hypothetical protein
MNLHRAPPEILLGSFAALADLKLTAGTKLEAKELHIAAEFV